jgi:glycine/D-amino acid oxidase-like deaminating enzyme
VWIAGGGSGHGFKHGPVVGEYMADRVTGRPPVPELERLFSLAGRA